MDPQGNEANPAKSAKSSITKHGATEQLKSDGDKFDFADNHKFEDYRVFAGEGESDDFDRFQRNNAEHLEYYNRMMNSYTHEDNVAEYEDLLAKSDLPFIPRAQVLDLLADYLRSENTTLNLALKCARTYYDLFMMCGEREKVAYDSEASDYYKLTAMRNEEWFREAGSIVRDLGGSAFANYDEWLPDQDLGTSND